MYRFSVVVAALFFMIGCQQEMPKESAALSESEISILKQEVSDAIDEMYDAVMISDVEGMFEKVRIEEDGILVNNLNMLNMVEAQETMIAFYDTLSNPTVRLEFSELNKKVVPLSRTVALVLAWTPEAHEHLENGDIISSKGSTLYVLKKENDEWLVHSLHQHNVPIEKDAPGEM